KDVWWRGPDFGRVSQSSEEDAVSSVMSAYRPGPSNGADDEGNINNPLTGGSYGNRRNYYSTKLIQLDLVSNSPARSESVFPMGIHEKYDGTNNVRMLNDVETLMGGSISNKLQEDITVRW